VYRIQSSVTLAHFGLVKARSGRYLFRVSSKTGACSDSHGAPVSAAQSERACALHLCDRIESQSLKNLAREQPVTRHRLTNEIRKLRIGAAIFGGEDLVPRLCHVSG
jgi:hypothetical protein